jgi:hypothetical protein
MRLPHMKCLAVNGLSFLSRMVQHLLYVTVKQTFNTCRSMITSFCALIMMTQDARQQSRLPLSLNLTNARSYTLSTRMHVSTFRTVSVKSLPAHGGTLRCTHQQVFLTLLTWVMRYTRKVTTRLVYILGKVSMINSMVLQDLSISLARYQ